MRFFEDVGGFSFVWTGEKESTKNLATVKFSDTILDCYFEIVHLYILV
jgi:hypothetical protein